MIRSVTHGDTEEKTCATHKHDQEHTVLFNQYACHLHVTVMPVECFRVTA